MGLLIGAEGVFTLTLPIIVGGYSDSLRNRIGGRMPFILAAGALAVPALIIMGFSGGSLVAISITLAVFFAAYFACQSSYYALFPNLVPEEMRGRSQGAAGGFRSAGMLVMLVGGGLLLAPWRPLPFLVGAVVIGGALAHRMEADPALRRVRQPHTVVRDLDLQGAAVGVEQPNGTYAGVGMAGDVRQRLLHDEVGGNLYGRRQRRQLFRRIDRGPEAVVTRAASRGAFLYGLDKPEFVESRRTEFVDQAPDQQLVKASQTPSNKTAACGSSRSARTPRCASTKLLPAALAASTTLS